MDSVCDVHFTTFWLAKLSSDVTTQIDMKSTLLTTNLYSVYAILITVQFYHLTWWLIKKNLDWPNYVISGCQNRHPVTFFMYVPQIMSSSKPHIYLQIVPYLSNTKKAKVHVAFAQFLVQWEQIFMPVLTSPALVTVFLTILVITWFSHLDK